MRWGIKSEDFENRFEMILNLSSLISVLINHIFTLKLFHSKQKFHFADKMLSSRMGAIFMSVKLND